jgi:multiple sugar transport system substrate-binding protein
MERRMRVGGLIATVALLAGACSPAATSPSPAASQPAASPSAQAPTGPVTLNVWVRNYTLDQDSPYKSAKAAFETKYPNVTVNLTGYAYDDLYQKVLLTKSGGEIPDVLTLDGPWLGQLVEEGILANLDSYYQNFSGAADIPANFLAASKWNGSYHGVWLNTDVRLMLWNKDVFKQAGLDPDVPPKTWDEVVQMGQQIQSKVPGVNGVGFPAAAEEGTADRFYPFVWMAGGDILSADLKTATIATDAWVNGTQFLVDLVHKYKVTPTDVLNQDADDIEMAVFAGKYGIMLSNVSTGQSDLEGADPATYGDHFGATQLPICTGCQPASNAGGYQLGVHAESENKDLAFEFIDLATSPDNILGFLVAQQRVPTRTSILLNQDAFKDLWYWDEVAKAVPVAHFAPAVPQYPTILERIYTAIQLSVQGDVAPRDALEAAQAEINAALGN